MENFKNKFKEVLNDIVPHGILNREGYIEEAVITFATELYSAAISKRDKKNFEQI